MQIRSFEHENVVIPGKVKKKINLGIFKFSSLNVLNHIELRKNEIGKACRTRDEIINAYKIEVGIF